MLIRNLISVISGLIMAGCFVPYGIDIIRGKVKPARSARIMFIVLLILALLQQRQLGAGWTLAITIGDGLGALAILALSLRRGIGGLRRLDVICYSLLALDVILWLTTKNTLLALHLTVLADLIAMFPTLAKTWHDPKSETPPFFIIGSIGPLVGVAATGQLKYAIVLFPLYLALINTLEVALIYRVKIIQEVGGILTG